jgi:hypothetical protein
MNARTGLARVSLSYGVANIATRTNPAWITSAIESYIAEGAISIDARVRCVTQRAVSPNAWIGHARVYLLYLVIFNHREA